MIGVPDSLIHQEKRMTDQTRKAEQFRAIAYSRKAARPL